MAKKPKWTREMLDPIILFMEVEKRSLYVEWGLPGSEETHETTSNIKKSKGVGSRMTQRMSRVATSQARRVASRSIRKVVGGGMAGRLASTGMRTATQEIRPGEGVSEAETDAAVIDAFSRVEKYFHYDESTDTWGPPGVAPPPPPKSPFEEQSAAHPIADPHDKNIFARIMAELAYADGHVAPEEAELFKAIIPPDQPGLDVLAKADPVSKIEAEEVTEGVKATIYMFAWVIALIDLDLDSVENELLMEYAEVFQLADAKRDEMIKNAKYYVLETNIDPDIPREELFQLAEKIKLTHDDAERCRIAYKRRLG